MSEILTPRLRLRRARTQDLDAIHAVLGNAQAMRYWSTPPHDGLDQTRAWLADMIAAPAQTSDDYVVERQGQVIGKAGCWRIPEVGFILHPDHWGQGLAREALTAVIGRVFASFPIASLEADVDPRNLASLRLLGRLRFEETGRARRTWKVGEVWCDSVYLALPRSRASFTGTAPDRGAGP
jgi:RimJ/RimL family protein N-acetyltransferase